MESMGKFPMVVKIFPTKTNLFIIQNIMIPPI